MVEQERISFNQEVISQIEKFSTLVHLVKYTHHADKIASQRYEIAKNRYMADNITVTELNIALEEKDLAKQEYISSLRNYWVTYYTLRLLTLYDFEKNKPLVNNEIQMIN